MQGPGVVFFLPRPAFKKNEEPTSHSFMLVQLVVAAILIWFLYLLSTTGSMGLDTFHQDPLQSQTNRLSGGGNNSGQRAQSDHPSTYASVADHASDPPPVYVPGQQRPTTRIEDLLPPKDQVTKWNQLNPDGDGPLNQSFLEGNHVGQNTVGSFRKNALLDWRGSVPNPRQQVSPWMNSSYDTITSMRTMDVVHNDPVE